MKDTPTHDSVKIINIKYWIEKKKMYVIVYSVLLQQIYCLCLIFMKSLLQEKAAMLETNGGLNLKKYKKKFIHT